VNVLCDNALLTGYALGKKEIDTGIIREVAEDLNITANVGARLRPIRQASITERQCLSQDLPAICRSPIRITRLEPKPTDVKQLLKCALHGVSALSFLDALVTALDGCYGSDGEDCATRSDQDSWRV